MAGKKRSLDYEVKPFVGAHAPAGVSEEASQELVERGLMEPPTRRAEEPRVRAREQASPLSTPIARTTPKPEPPRPSPPTIPSRTAPSPTWEKRDAGTTAPSKQAPIRHQEDTKRAGKGDQQGTDARVQRTMRFTSVIDKKLRELAEARGIDLNAAVSVAIAEDWKETCGR